MNNLSLLAFIAGAAIATQASMNAQLGMLLKSALLATSVAFTGSFLFTLIAVIVTTKHYPPADVIKSVPLYLWFSGAALSAFAVALFYYLIPQMGFGQMMSYALAGQIIVAIISSHFGWFELPQVAINQVKLVEVQISQRCS